MKNFLLLCITLLCFQSGAFAQRSDQSKSLDTTATAKTYEAGWGTLNYAVPESPAFKILGTSPSAIMRPTSTRNIAFSIGNYFLNNGASIPQNLAVEISPALFDQHLSLSKFRQNRFWYTSALSIGTKVNSDKSYAIGVGLKFKLLDEQDLRMNDLLIQKFKKFGRNLNDAYTAALDTVTAILRSKETNPKPYIEYLSDVSDAYKDSANPKHQLVTQR